MRASTFHCRHRRSQQKNGRASLEARPCVLHQSSEAGLLAAATAAASTTAAAATAVATTAWDFNLLLNHVANLHFDLFRNLVRNAHVVGLCLLLRLALHVANRDRAGPLFRLANGVLHLAGLLFADHLADLVLRGPLLF